jgi:hypothetical protein
MIIVNIGRIHPTFWFHIDGKLGAKAMIKGNEKEKYYRP